MLELSETIERKFIDSIDLDEWEIETDSGWQDITAIHKTIEYQVWKIETETGLILECADDHIVFDDNMNQIFVKDCIPNMTKIATKNGFDLVKSIDNLNYFDNMFDITVNSNDHRYYTNDILSHNTTTAVVILLHYVLFNDHKLVALLANKGDAAREILDRIKLSFEELPQWLQSGIKYWNKGSVELENGCKIIAGSTTSSAIRGKSCLTGDTRICIEENDSYYFVEIDKVINKLNSSK